MWEACMHPQNCDLRGYKQLLSNYLFVTSHKNYAIGAAKSQKVYAPCLRLGDSIQPEPPVFQQIVANHIGNHLVCDKGLVFARHYSHLKHFHILSRHQLPQHYLHRAPLVSSALTFLARVRRLQGRFLSFQQSFYVHCRRLWVIKTHPKAVYVCFLVRFAHLFVASSPLSADEWVRFHGSKPANSAICLKCLCIVYLYDPYFVNNLMCAIGTADMIQQTWRRPLQAGREIS